MPPYVRKGVNHSYREIYRSASSRHNGNTRRDWRQNNETSRRVTETPRATRSRWCLLLASLFTILCIIFIVIIIWNVSDDPIEVVTECPPGFSGKDCQSTSFIGSYLWSDKKVYRLVDGRYYSQGIAFRVYAPGADGVNVVTFTPNEDERITAMIKQDDGYWFCNVGGVELGCEYVYRVIHEGKTETHLIQNGKYLVHENDASWRNVELDSLSVDHPIRRYSLRSSRLSSYEVIYTVHLSSYSPNGNYSGMVPYLQRIHDLGVTMIRFLTLDPHTCEGESKIDRHCWYRPNNVYFGIPHPGYGTQEELRSLIQSILDLGMSVIVDMDITKFTSHSDWYNYDGTASATSFGSLFQSTPLYLYDSRTCAKPVLQSGSPSRSLLISALRRYVNAFGFKGFYWKGILCLRLDGENCETGDGTDNTSSISFLKSLYTEGWTLYGEDKKGVIQVKNPSSLIQNIVDVTSNRGLAFDGQLDLSVGQLLCSSILSSSVNGKVLIDFVKGFSSRQFNFIIPLATPESSYEEGRLYKQSFDIDKDQVKAIQRLLLLETLFSFTPGILQIFMGDEYFTEVPFQKYPANLDIQSSLEGGDHRGIFNYTKSLLAFRHSQRLFESYTPEVYFQTEDSDVFAFLLKANQQRVVCIVNTNSNVIKDLEIDLPSIPEAYYEWSYVINSDSSWIYKGITDYNQGIVLGKCIEPHGYDTCANVTLGAYSVKVVEIISKTPV